MSGKELGKLKREELLEMLIEQSKKVKALEERLEYTEQKLKSREINVNRAGSIAEAALQLNGVFEAAEAACQQYIENVERLNEHQKLISEQIKEEAFRRAKVMMTETQNKCMIMEANTKKKCQNMLEEAAQESENYCLEVSSWMEKLYEDYEGLSKLIANRPAYSAGRQKHEEKE